MHRFLTTFLYLVFIGLFTVDAAWAQQAHRVRADNRPLPSLREAGAAALAAGPRFKDQYRFVPNKKRSDSRTQQPGFEGPDPLLQPTINAANTNLLTSFDGADNDDNAAALGFRIAPPDTDGDVGPNHFVQMINLLTTVFDKNGNIVAGGGPFPSNAFWSGAGGSCETYNQGDPIVLYDEANDRWLVSQFAFDDNFTANTLAQCVAVSQTNDPLGAYNRYEFSFETVGLPDYPKHGFTTESVTMMANIFAPPSFFYSGTYLGAIDKDAMYAGTAAQLVGFNIGTGEFGFVAGDLDDASGTAGFVPALFGTAMSRNNLFDVWELTPDFANNGAGASVNRVAGISISPFDTDFCTASREACIPQPSPGSALETLSDRLMHRLQIRDFGGYKTMVASHTVDVGGSRAGVRWYEMRDSGSGWTLYQEGTYAPNDGENRWVPSIAMNAAGDIGLGYLISSSSTFLSVGTTGQSAANSGTGQMDGTEATCIAGTGAQTQAARAGDYAATKVDPVTDTFWHTNEYGRVTGTFEWATRVCEFEVITTPGGTDLHVENLATGIVQVNKKRKRGTATITIEDDLGNPIAGVTVTGNFSGSITETGASGVTGGNGTVTISTGGTTNSNNPTINFCVSGVSGSLPYDPADNASAGYACSSGGGGNPSDVHVASISTGQQGVGQGQKRGTATVTIQDDLGNPAAGYLVTGNFSGDFNETGASGTTAGDGSVTIATSGTKNGKVNVSFCVSSVSGTLPYDPNDNGSGSYACGGAKGNLSASETPDGFVLEQNYPNPFNPTTLLAFSIPEAAHVTLRVYNVLGQEVETLLNATRAAGRHEVAFDATSLSAGVYLYVIEAGAYTATRRMTLLK